MSPAVALVVVAMGLLACGAALARGSGLHASLALGLDFWIGAGLIRLTSRGSWQALAGVAVVILIRQMVMRFGLRPIDAADAGRRARGRA
ncbi:DUF1622 domain-containing protein [Miltoncostaea marina]|uniref:DUF1622 domain-containing protein n=1 Tax=Miltoncostaea marina TaxID=2843215 RepID=UPI001C3D89CF|nr:DUF1622 domain-containing protein [Miltoncostaea marina]